MTRVWVQRGLLGPGELWGGGEGGLETWGAAEMAWKLAPDWTRLALPLASCPQTFNHSFRVVMSWA